MDKIHGINLIRDELRSSQSHRSIGPWSATMDFAVGQAMARAGQIFADAWMVDSMGTFLGVLLTVYLWYLLGPSFAPCLFFRTEFLHRLLSLKLWVGG